MMITTEHDYRMYRGVYIMQSTIIIAYIVGFVFQVIGHHSDVSIYTTANDEGRSTC